MWNIILLTAFFIAAAVVYRFRKPILLRLARFDARNAARRAEELRDRRDRFAHYRRAVQTAEESLEEVTQVTVPDPRTGQPLKRFLFLGEHYLTRNEAEIARRARAVALAREFYAELDGRSLAPAQPQQAPPQATLPEPNLEPENETTPPRPS